MTAFSGMGLVSQDFDRHPGQVSELQDGQEPEPFRGTYIQL